MPIDLEAIAAQKMQRRTEHVPCSLLCEDLKAGCSDGDTWDLQGLTGNELSICNAAEAKYQKQMGTVLDALNEVGGAVQELRKALGLGKATTGETAKRLEMLVLGSVKPTVNLQNAVMIAERFPYDFIFLTNKITALTGLGFEVVKPVAASQSNPDSTQA